MKWQLVIFAFISASFAAVINANTNHHPDSEAIVLKELKAMNGPLVLQALGQISADKHPKLIMKWLQTCPAPACIQQLFLSSNLRLPLRQRLFERSKAKGNCRKFSNQPDVFWVPGEQIPSLLGRKNERFVSTFLLPMMLPRTFDTAADQAFKNIFSHALLASHVIPGWIDPAHSMNQAEKNLLRMLAPAIQQSGTFQGYFQDLLFAFYLESGSFPELLILADDKFSRFARYMVDLGFDWRSMSTIGDTQKAYDAFPVVYMPSTNIMMLAKHWKLDVEKISSKLFTHSYQTDAILKSLPEKPTYSPLEVMYCQCQIIITSGSVMRRIQPLEPVYAETKEEAVPNAPIAEDRPKRKADSDLPGQERPQKQFKQTKEIQLDPPRRSTREARNLPIDPRAVLRSPPPPTTTPISPKPPARWRTSKESTAPPSNYPPVISLPPPPTVSSPPPPSTLPPQQEHRSEPISPLPWLCEPLTIIESHFDILSQVPPSYTDYTGFPFFNLQYDEFGQGL